CELPAEPAPHIVALIGKAAAESPVEIVPARDRVGVRFHRASVLAQCIAQFQGSRPPVEAVKIVEERITPAPMSISVWTVHSEAVAEERVALARPAVVEDRDVEILPGFQIALAEPLHITSDGVRAAHPVIDGDAHTR